MNGNKANLICAVLIEQTPAGRYLFAFVTPPRDAGSSSSCSDGHHHPRKPQGHRCHTAIPQIFQNRKTIVCGSIALKTDPPIWELIHSFGAQPSHT